MGFLNNSDLVEMPLVKNFCDFKLTVKFSLTFLEQNYILPTIHRKTHIAQQNFDPYMLAMIHTTQHTGYY